MNPDLFVHAGEPLVVTLHHTIDVFMRWRLNRAFLIVIIGRDPGLFGGGGDGLVERLLLKPK